MKQPGMLMVIVLFAGIIAGIDIVSGETSAIEEADYSAEWTVNFTASPTEGFPPLCVQFNVEGPKGEYVWEFGDGTTGSSQNPVHCYRSKGLYWVKLKYWIGEIAGEIEKPEFIQVFDPELFVDFTAEPSVGKAPLTTRFNLIGSPTNFIWDFGDGSDDSREMSPVHQYAVADNYSPTLTYCIGDSCQRISKYNYIEVYPNDPLFITPERTSGIAPLCTKFIVNGTADTYSWNFGDGTGSYERDPVHCYPEPGIYNVTLSYSVEGAHYGNETYVTVNFRYPPDFNASPRSGTAPFCVKYSTINSPPSWEWDYGDNSFGYGDNMYHCYGIAGTFSPSMHYTVNNMSGTVKKTDLISVDAPEIIVEEGDNPATFRFRAKAGEALKYKWSFGNDISSEEVSPVYTYDYPGTYQVSLSVEGLCGCMASNITTLTVKPEKPLDFTATPLTGCAPHCVQFREVAPEIPVSRLWEFGDGATSTEKNPFHCYQFGGKYTVKLVSTLPDREENKTKENYITVHGVPNPFFTAYPTNGYAPLTVQFSDKTQDLEVRRFWEFGDRGTSTAAVVNHEFVDEGDYNVSLIVWGEGECWGRRTQTIHVMKQQSVKYDLTGLPRRGIVPVCTAFKITGLPYQKQVEFGDGQSSEEDNPFYCYTAPGIFTPTLHACDAEGCEDIIKQDYVVAIPAYYQNLSLNEGWNLVSVPLTLTPGQDTAEIFSEVNTAGHSLFTWNSGSMNWTRVSKEFRLDPLGAVWVYAYDAIEIPLNYASEGPGGNLTRLLAPGWNLVSFPDVMEPLADQAFKSVSDEWTYAVGYDAISQRYFAPIINGEDSSTIQVSPLQGYWLYMNASGVLETRGI